MILKLTTIIILKLIKNITGKSFQFIVTTKHDRDCMYVRMYGNKIECEVNQFEFQINRKYI